MLAAGNAAPTSVGGGDQAHEQAVAMEDCKAPDRPDPPPTQQQLNTVSAGSGSTGISGSNAPQQQQQAASAQPSTTPDSGSQLHTKLESWPADLQADLHVLASWPGSSQDLKETR